MTRRAVALLVVVLAGAPATANATILCLGEAGTREYICIDEGGVRVNGDIRASRIYVGQQRDVRRTPYRLVAHCKKNVQTLQNDDGVNLRIFDLATANWRLLSIWLCESKPSEIDPRLAMPD